MALADDIRTIRDQTLRDLAAAHDYYTDTQIAWRVVHDVIANGYTIKTRNMITQTVSTEVDLKAKSRGMSPSSLHKRPSSSSSRSSRISTLNYSASG